MVAFLARSLAWSLVARVALGDVRFSMVARDHAPETHATQDLQLCTVDQVLSTDDYRLSDGWTDVMVEVMPYNCSCAMPRARYFCPSAPDREYPMWEVLAAKEGKCALISREKLVEEPFPSGFNILVYGNSHLRQVVEGIMCMTSDALFARDVIYDGQRVTVGGEVQCRGCVSQLQLLKALMVDNSCVDRDVVEKACSCSDDSSIFRFANGATLHYFFAGNQVNKTIDQALEAQRLETHYFDVIFANVGNAPTMSAEAMLASAEATHRAGVAFFWLTTYGGKGDLDVLLSSDQKSSFQSLGARFINIHDMMKGVLDYTKGHVEGISDSHFCMPGPTNEINLLVMQLVWLEWYNRSKT